MKTAVQLDTLRVRVRGLPPATAAAAVRDLGPALARALGAGPAAPAPTLSANPPAAAVRAAVAARTAAALRPHLARPA